MLRNGHISTFGLKFNARSELPMPCCKIVFTSVQVSQARLARKARKANEEQKAMLVLQ